MNSNKSHELEADPVVFPNESCMDTENTPSFSASSSSKPSKFSSHPSSSSIISNGSEKRKKKSWVKNALNPTYRSRCEDLIRNFPGLPPDETLIVDYSCALQKDILVHGRLYVTTNFLCFYANIFRWETAVTIRWREASTFFHSMFKSKLFQYSLGHCNDQGEDSSGDSQCSSDLHW